MYMLEAPLLTDSRLPFIMNELVLAGARSGILDSRAGGDILGRLPVAELATRSSP